MITHSLIQGSPDWHQYRLTHFGASEAAAMLGISPKVKRTELLHMKHTGTAKEFSDWVQENILDYGHEVEARARPLVEGIIGDDLYPVTCSDGLYSASCDGLTMSEEIAFEHKQWNAALAASVTAGELPEAHAPQCQQILMVTGAQKVVFVVSDGTAEKMVHMDVLPDPEWFERIRAGWEQFAKDMADYQPRQLAEKPQAEAIMALPALVVQIRGEVATSNLPQFKAAADLFIANIKTDLQTDQDFADAEKTVKFCDDAEKNLKLTKSAAIAQTASIDDLMRTIDHITEQLRVKRLMLDKLITSKKTEIKESILAEAKLAFVEHVAGLEKEIKPIRLVYAQPDFVGAMKNKRTLASLHDAVDSLLASAKIATNATAAGVRAKLAWCKTNAEGYGFLFMDMQQLVGKAEDDFQLVITTRIAEHKKAEEVKAEEARAKIREEERIKAEAAAAETVRLVQVETERLAAEQAKQVKAAADLVTAQESAASTTRAAPVAPGAEAEVERLQTFYAESPRAAVAPLVLSGRTVEVRIDPAIIADNLGASTDLHISDDEIIELVSAEYGISAIDAIDRLAVIDFAALRAAIEVAA